MKQFFSVVPTYACNFERVLRDVPTQAQSLLKKICGAWLKEFEA